MAISCGSRPCFAKTAKIASATMSSCVTSMVVVSGEDKVRERKRRRVDGLYRWRMSVVRFMVLCMSSCADVSTCGGELLAVWLFDAYVAGMDARTRDTNPEESGMRGVVGACMLVASKYAHTSQLSMSFILDQIASEHDSLVDRRAQVLAAELDVLRRVGYRMPSLTWDTDLFLLYGHLGSTGAGARVLASTRAHLLVFASSPDALENSSASVVHAAYVAALAVAGCVGDCKAVLRAQDVPISLCQYTLLAQKIYKYCCEARPDEVDICMQASEVLVGLKR